ncbi:TPA: phage tail family protein [Bacillus cereus]|uniref:distal tail protein Dit n=1 Tax=Bacillus cereus TaxID=1396 RepID=UPI000B788AA6|nr:distal tail protein Dit [Bacillus cereus]HDW8003310.1 phage tail family protein [Bacillus cereus]HDW8008969.1 phage tail family protein [Bacillus cereus]HDW8014070.1 phage tail family protein [Bacillus cereus]HDW8020506.1 phage tail family protein [Bacillus cereus]HDW8025486.1 phage tail family protein [Bacillus cereus]
MSSFTFNNIRKDFIQIEKGWKRPTWAPVKRNFLSVPGYTGARLLNTQTEMRVLSIPVGIIVPEGSDLETMKEEIAEWLITGQPAELIFDAEPNRTYLAVVEDTFDPDEFVTLGIGTIKFICPMPYKLGPTRTVGFQTDGSGLIASVQNKGTVESEPIIEIEVENPSTFLDVWRGNEYFRIGYPLQVNQLPVERKQRVMWDEMSTIIGWTNVSEFEDAKGGGVLKTNGNQVYVTDYGDNTYKGHHGAIMKKSIPGGPLQDFIMSSYVRFISSSYVQMGRVEIALLDESSKPVARLSMNDVFWEAEETHGFAKLAYPGHPAEQTMINTRGKYSNTWNNFYGRLQVYRIGNEWEFFITKFAEGTEIDDAGAKARWVDADGILMNKVAQIQLSITQWWNNDPAQTITVDDIKVWKVNQNTSDNPPYIIEQGDKVRIDTEKSLVSINGASAINLKDLFSDYPKIDKGQNKLEIMPANIGKAKVIYRERYR